MKLDKVIFAGSLYTNSERNISIYDRARGLNINTVPTTEEEDGEDRQKRVEEAFKKYDEFIKKSDVDIKYSLVPMDNSYLEDKIEATLITKDNKKAPFGYLKSLLESLRPDAPVEEFVDAVMEKIRKNLSKPLKEILGYDPDAQNQVG